MRVITDDPTMRAYDSRWWDSYYLGRIHHPSETDKIHFERAAEIVGSGSVVDLGCGEGWFAQHVASEDYLGVDWSRACISRAKLRYPTRDFAVGDALLFFLEGEPYDWAVAFELFEHLPEPERLLRKMAEIARAGIVCLPRGDEGQKVVAADRKRIAPLGLPTEYHHATYSEDDIAAMLPGAEFVPVDEKHIMFVLHFGDRVDVNA